MKTRLAVLVLVIPAALAPVFSFMACRGANEVTGQVVSESPGESGPKRTQGPTVIAVRQDPVLASRPRGTGWMEERPAVVTLTPTRPPTPTPTPRAYPCVVAGLDMKWKNEPCRPCDDVVVGLRRKNKPCHVYPTPSPKPRP